MPHSHVYKIWTPQASSSVSKFHKYLLWGVRTTIIKLAINQGCFDNVHCHTIIIYDINFKQLVNWSSPCEAMLYLHVVLTCYSLINIHLHYLKYTMSLQIINGFIVNLYTNNVDNNYTHVYILLLHPAAELSLIDNFLHSSGCRAWKSREAKIACSDHLHSF